MTTVVEVNGKLKFDTKDVDEGTKKAEKSLTRLGKVGKTDLAGLGLAVGAVGISLGAMTKAAEMAFSAIKEGAQLELARSRFENLSASINTTSDSLLGKLREATSGMVSDAQLVASATDMISLGFAKTEEQAVRLTSVAGQLGWNMSQLTLTLANQSTMRLDALGLSVADVTGRFKELKASGMEAQDAFQMAVIEAGEKKLKLLGSAAETSAGKMMKFDASVENITTSLKLAAVELATNIGLIDRLVEVSSGLSRGAGFAEELNNAFKLGKIDLEQYDFLLNAVVGKGDILGRNGEVLVAGSMRLKDTYVELNSMLAAGLITQEEHNKLWKEASEDYAAVAERIDEVRAVQDGYNAQLTYGAGITGYYIQQKENEVDAVMAASGAQKKWRDILSLSDEQLAAGAEHRQQYAADMERAAQVEEWTAAAAERAAAAVAQLSAAFNGVSADYRNPLEGADEPLVTPASTTSVVTGGLSQEQSDLLREYGELAGKAQKEIYNLTNGIGTFGIEQDKVNTKIAEAQEELAYYQALMAPLSGVVGDVSTKENELSVNVAAVHSELYKQAEAAGAAPEQLIALAVATGEMSEAQATAALKAAAVVIEVEKLGRLIAAGYPVDKALDDLDTFIVKLEGGVVPASEEAQAAALGIRDKMIEAAEGALEPAEELGTNVATGLQTGIEDASGDAEDAAGDMADDVIQSARDALGVQSPSTVFAGIGENVIAGLVQGFWNNAASVEEALSSIINTAIARIKAALGITSPSLVFMEIGEQIGAGLVAGLGNSKDLVTKAIQTLVSSVIGIAKGFASEFERTVTDPILDAIDAIDEATDGAADTFDWSVHQLKGYYSDAIINNIADMDYSDALDALRGLRYYQQYQNDPEAARRVDAAIHAADEQRRMAEERNALEAEYIEQQERLLELEEKRAQFDFLKMQMDLLQLITENGLDAGAVLGGLELGLDADAGGLVDAMNRAMEQMIAAAEDTLGIASPSKVAQGLAANFMSSFAGGLGESGALVAAVQRSLDRMSSSAARSITDNSRSLVNYGGIFLDRGSAYGDLVEELYGTSR